jgi:hypothetical protein
MLKPQPTCSCTSSRTPATLLPFSSEPQIAGSLTNRESQTNRCLNSSLPEY